MAVRRVFGAAYTAVFLVAFVLFARGHETLLAAAAVPPAPVGLTAKVTGTTVTLSWTPGAGTKSTVTYQLEAGPVSGSSNLPVFPTRKTAETVASAPFGTYWVRVRAQSANGMSAPSNQVQLTVGCGGPPPAPANFVAAVSGATASMSWGAVALATSYTVEVGSAPGAKDVSTLTSATTSVVANAPTGTYYARVRAVSACGTGAASAEQILYVNTAPAVEICGNGIDDDGDGQIDEGCAPPAVEICGNGIDDDGDGQIDEGCATTPHLGHVDAAILGTCPGRSTTATSSTAATATAIAPGIRRRCRSTAAGCTFAHEHGDDPQRMTNAEIAASPVRFGYIGRRMDHEEAHEGFKVFIALPGDVNNEVRVNRVFSRSVFHMGTGGPKRFDMQHHSAEIRLIHPEFGLKAFTQLMMDTGGVGAVCDRAQAAPTKDVVQLQLALRADLVLRDLEHHRHRCGSRVARSTGPSPRRRCSIRSPCATPPIPPRWSTRGTRGSTRRSIPDQRPQRASAAATVRATRSRATGTTPRRPHQLLHRCAWATNCRPRDPNALEQVISSTTASACRPPTTAWCSSRCVATTAACAARSA